MTELIYLTDSYNKHLTTKVVSIVQKGNTWEIVLEQTIFYPQGGGQPSDKGEIVGKQGKAHVKHVRMNGDTVVHEATLEGTLEAGQTVECTIDWDLRYYNMRVHSAGHVVHEATMEVSPTLIPKKGEHGDKPYIEYEGSLTADKARSIEQHTNAIVARNVSLLTEFVTLEELQKRASYVPEHLPKHKPLRILTIEGYKSIPDGGTQVAKSGQVGLITITEIKNEDGAVRVYYAVEKKQEEQIEETAVSSQQLSSLLLEVQQDILSAINQNDKPVDVLRLELLGGKSEFAALARQIKNVPQEDRQRVGILINEVKKSIESALTSYAGTHQTTDEWLDVTAPGTVPPQGHLHIVTQAISEITRIFERIGFTRVRHPEVDWDWYPFESLNMPHSHPASDEWETFFIDTLSRHSRVYPEREGGNLPSKETRIPHQVRDDRRGKIVLTPHTSNGQVREMEKGKLPIRMINIAKCYRRQVDVSHTPMFHQFEGLYIDKNVSIGHLKGVVDYFFKQFYGPDRVSRLRPFHFQFTEPSFEIDVSCGICHGKGLLPDGQVCKLCKEGWLELGGAGMVHPTVLRNGGIDPAIYNGFAFGWGVERTSMMKSDTKLDDIRILYSNDVRFLEQF